MSNNKTELAVIGAGPGGYPAAFRAADLGIGVTLIDTEPNPGGVCLYRGCIPSKALLHVAKIISEAGDASNLGVKFTKPKLDIKKIATWKNDVIEKLTGGAGFLAKQRKVNYIQGKASFIDSKTLKILRTDGNEETLSFNNCVIATGSVPATIPGIDVDNKKILNSKGALELDEVPKKLLVIAGGYIGLEMGTVYAALGSKVTIVEMLDGLVVGADRDLVKVLQKRVEKIFDSILLNTKVVEVKNNKSGLKVKFQDKDVTREESFDKVLVSVGRKPNTQSLGLENTQIKLDEKGFIRVDNRRRTTDDNIYAIGDVAGDPMLAHKATHEGRVVAEIIKGHDVVYAPHAIPAVIFTDPEIAWCGITEEEAKEKNLDVKITKFPWGASGRAITLDRTDGLTKMIIDNETERILGVGIVGSGAGELISEGVLAVEMSSVASDVSLSVHPHPTLTETFMEAAEMFYGSSTHVIRKTKK